MDEIRVVVFGDDARVRERVITMVGVLPDPALPRLRFTEIATAAALLTRIGAGDIDLVILDGEATPAGGLGLARQLGDELTACPPLVVLLGRPADAWLAKWSRADAAVPWLSDPMRLSEVIVRTLRQRVSSTR